MKVPAEQSTMNEANPKDFGILRMARGLLFGIGGFDGNASLAVLASSLDEELTAQRIAKNEVQTTQAPTSNEAGPY